MRLIFVAGLALVSCKSETTADAPTPPEPEKGPSHPWEWTPTDPALLAGKGIYAAECASCHNEGEEGAPALTKAKEWSKREAKGMEILFDHAINGFDGADGEMPARGGTPTLTDEEVKNAVAFMIKSPKESYSNLEQSIIMSFFKKLFGKKEAPAEPEKPAAEPMPDDHPTDHPLTLEQKILVQESWEKVKPISDTAAELFYGKLFELDPELKPMFANSDMKEQGKKLMLMIGTAVKGLDTLGELVPAVQKLGARHVGYGVKASHYDTVGEALLDTLAKGLGDDFTDEAKEAWTITYTTLAGVMIEASDYEAA